MSILKWVQLDSDLIENKIIVIKILVIYLLWQSQLSMIKWDKNFCIEEITEFLSVKLKMGHLLFLIIHHKPKEQSKMIIFSYSEKNMKQSESLILKNTWIKSRKWLDLYLRQVTITTIKWSPNPSHDWDRAVIHLLTSPITSEHFYKKNRSSQDYQFFRTILK